MPLLLSFPNKKFLTEDAVVKMLNAHIYVTEELPLLKKLIVSLTVF